MPRGHRRGQRAQKEDPVQAVNHVPEPNPERAQRTVIFSKTKMCKFHILGMCAKGTGCKFAHHKDELNPLPDLSRTKLCKTLISTGSCEDPDCKYAHNREQLRAMPEAERLFGADAAASLLAGGLDHERRTSSGSITPPLLPYNTAQTGLPMTQSQLAATAQQLQQLQQLQQQQQQQQGSNANAALLQAYIVGGLTGAGLANLPMGLPSLPQPQTAQEAQAQLQQLQMVMQQQFLAQQASFQQLPLAQQQQLQQQIQQLQQQQLQQPEQLLLQKQAQQQQQQLLGATQMMMMQQNQPDNDRKLVVKNTFYDYDSEEAPEMPQVPRCSTWAGSLNAFARAASAESLVSLTDNSPGGFEQQKITVVDGPTLGKGVGGPATLGSRTNQNGTLGSMQPTMSGSLGLRRGANANASKNNLSTLDEAGEHDAHDGGEYNTSPRHNGWAQHHDADFVVKNTFIEVDEEVDHPSHPLRSVHTAAGRLDTLG